MDRTEQPKNVGQVLPFLGVTTKPVPNYQATSIVSCKWLIGVLLVTPDVLLSHHSFVVSDGLSGKDARA